VIRATGPEPTTSANAAPARRAARGSASSVRLDAGLAPPSRGAVWIGRTVGLLRHAPVAVGLLVVLWVVGAVTDSLRFGPAPPLRMAVALGVPGLVTGRWWSLLTAAVWCAGPAAYVMSSVLLLVLVAPAEQRIGSQRTALLLVTCQVIGGGVCIALLVGLSTAVGGDWVQRLGGEVALGPSAGAVGVALAASARLGVLWRRRLQVGLTVVLALFALYSGSLADIVRLLAGMGGLLLGPLVLGRLRDRPRLIVSGPETRILLAALVAASAVGPLVAALSGTAIGPLSVLRLLVLPPTPDPAAVVAVCADPANLEDCVGLQYRLRLSGVGPAIMSVLPVALLLVLADGLRRGRRFAWWAASGLNLGFALLGAGLAVLVGAAPGERLVAFGGASDRQFYTGVITSVAQPLAIVALLYLTRARFPVRAPARAYRGPAIVVGATLGLLCVVYVVGSLLAADQYTPRPNVLDLLADLPTRFLPPGYLGEIEIAFLPTAPVATMLYEWIGVVFWTVALTAVLWMLRRTPLITQNAHAARQLLIRHGGSSLSWLTTWAGNEYWFDDDRRAAIAYRVIGRIALTVGEPFGAPCARTAAVSGFARFCADHAWIPCLYSVGDTIRDAALALGWRNVQVAEETLVDLPGLTFSGKRWQDVRTALSKAAAAGVTAEWVTFSRAPRAITDQIRAISEEWVADKGLPEMEFTLGGVDELADDQVRCLIAVDADRTVHGVTSWLPVYGSTTDFAHPAQDAGGSPAVIVGWTLDFMRRRDTGPDGLRGIMDFLIASAAQAFQRDGAAFVSLSGAPLARLDRATQPDSLQRLLDRSGRALEPVYGFRSLLAFKAKFQPRYLPLFMAYPDAAALPAIAAAIARAYLPDLDVSHAWRLLRLLHRR
jgi:phosphatidylglycerol lysyltransferase